MKRRDLLRAIAAAPLAGGFACGASEDRASAPNGSPTPGSETPAASAAPTTPKTPRPRLADRKPGSLPLTCGERTKPSIEGPYFKPGSPERSDLLADLSADAGSITRMTVTGRVLTPDCFAVGGALVELWHADEDGAYDNVGFHLRGHQLTANDGTFRFETLVPGLYPGRTRHFHVKVQPKGAPMLTTQLYFPNDPDNAKDGYFLPELVLDVTQSGSAVQGSFEFVVEV